MARLRGTSVSSIKLLLVVMAVLLRVSWAQNCLQKNGISVGWLPDEDNGGKMTDITSLLGASACYYGLYSQITSTTYDDSQLTSRMSDIQASGAILQAAVMPTGVTFSEVTTDLASQIAASMKKFTDNGIQVWLRFAHEMNYYTEADTNGAGNGPEYPGGTTEEFIQAWQNVANAVKGNSDVKMFWSPNQDDVGDLEQWWPGPDYVDVVGMDVYPTSSTATSFSGVYGSFIDTYSTPYSKTFAVGETGANGCCEDANTKQTWLTQLSAAASLSSYPSYVGFSWFEYLKGGVDFRVVTGSEDYAKPILT